jgi:hypothetical protein
MLEGREELTGLPSRQRRRSLLHLSYIQTVNKAHFALDWASTPNYAPTYETEGHRFESCRAR